MIDNKVSLDETGLKTLDPGPGIVRRTFRWISANKVKTVLMIAAVCLGFLLAPIPFVNIHTINSEAPGETALMRQRVEEAREEGRSLAIRHEWIPIRRLPRHFIQAIIVAEDGTFYEHGGIDWFEVQESFNRNIERGRIVRGASTITQQLAKNLYLSTSRDPLRKLREVIITLLLEQQLGKDRILELYVNIIEWGRGVFGVETAARVFFGKSASSLTLDESLRLASVIPSPLRHNPAEDSRYVLRRKEIVRRRMLARNFIAQTKEDIEQGPVKDKQIIEEEPDDMRDTSQVDISRDQPEDDGNEL